MVKVEASARPRFAARPPTKTGPWFEYGLLHEVGQFLSPGLKWGIKSLFPEMTTPTDHFGVMEAIKCETSQGKISSLQWDTERRPRCSYLTMALSCMRQSRCSIALFVSRF